MDSIQVSFEGVDMCGPEFAEGNQPLINLPQRLRAYLVQTPLSIDPGLDKSGVPKDSEMFRNRRLRHFQLPFNIPDRLFGRRKQAQYCPAIGFNEHLESRWHAYNIHTDVYTFKSIW